MQGGAQRSCWSASTPSARHDGHFREIGSGVVPMTPEERKLAGLHGQVLRLCGEPANRVFRIFCGLAGGAWGGVDLIAPWVHWGTRRRLYYGSTDLPLLPEGWEALAVFARRGGYPTAARYYTTSRHAADRANAFGSVRSGPPHGVTRAAGNGFWHFLRWEPTGAKQDAAYQKVDLRQYRKEHVCPNGESGVK